MEIKAIRGFNDVLPEEIGKWQFVEKTAREVFEGFGFSEIRIPVIERTELFSRGIGEATDIVEKEMYTFTDRSGNSLTLRPEATASMAGPIWNTRSTPSIRWQSSTSWAPCSVTKAPRRADTGSSIRSMQRSSALEIPWSMPKSSSCSSIS